MFVPLCVCVCLGGQREKEEDRLYTFIVTFKLSFLAVTIIFKIFIFKANKKYWSIYSLPPSISDTIQVKYGCLFGDGSVFVFFRYVDDSLAVSVWLYVFKFVLFMFSFWAVSFKNLCSQNYLHFIFRSFHGKINLSNELLSSCMINNI